MCTCLTDTFVHVSHAFISTIFWSVQTNKKSLQNIVNHSITATFTLTGTFIGCLYQNQTNVSFDLSSFGSKYLYSSTSGPCFTSIRASTILVTGRLCRLITRFFTPEQKKHFCAQYDIVCFNIKKVFIYIMLNIKIWMVFTLIRRLKSCWTCPIPCLPL